VVQGRTTIVIAHRFSTIRSARTIHVMQDETWVPVPANSHFHRCPRNEWWQNPRNFLANGKIGTENVN
jgi:hypothetical protein